MTTPRTAAGPDRTPGTTPPATNDPSSTAASSAPATNAPPRTTGVGTTLSVVVPVYNSATTLEACIAALVAAVGPGDELIVVDDGSTDGGCRNLPSDLADSITEVVNPTNIGRGPARNLGAAAATGDVLVFVDADVAVHPDALGRLRQWFADDHGHMAAIGSYDDRPAAPGLVSQYRNLLHHHTHHTRGTTATHFWTGLGAVRRHLFDDLGGLDNATWARNMEDVEFGHRIVDAGHRIDVLPGVQGSHHKSLSLSTMVHIDLMDRAIPWSTLMIRQGLRRDPFVVSVPQATAALAATVAVVALVVAPVNRAGRLVAAAAAGLFLAVNARLFGFLARVRGVGFAIAAIPLHALHTAVSLVGFALAAANETRRLVATPARRAIHRLRKRRHHPDGTPH